MKIRIFAFLLALLLLCSLIVGCNDPETPDDPDNTPSDDKTPGNQDSGDGENPDDTGEVDVLALLSTYDKDDYEKTEFNICASSSYENIFIIHQFPTMEEKSGDIVLDELFARDSMLEEYFNVDIVYDDTLDSAMPGKLISSVQSGDDTYSLVLGVLVNIARQLFNQDLLHDLNQIEEIDLTKSWWNQNSVDNFTYNGQIYMATGAITNRYVYAPYAVLFNRRLITDLSLEDPYAMVEEGTWTLEEFIEMIELQYVDQNSNLIADTEDFYGLAPSSDSETAWFFAAGNHFITKDDSGEFIVTLSTEDNLDMLDMIADMYALDDVLKYKATYDSVHLFGEGNAIFHSTALCDITMLNEMEDAYGIVPVPKYDEDQENYISNANCHISTMALLPTSIVDTHAAALVVEAMAAVSQYTSLDKQYEQVLLNRQALDAQSKNCLRTVVESVSYDWLYMYDMAGLGSTVRDRLRVGESDFSSLFASYVDQVEDELEKLKEVFD